MGKNGLVPFYCARVVKFSHNSIVSRRTASRALFSSSSSIFFYCDEARALLTDAARVIQIFGDNRWIWMGLFVLSARSIGMERSASCCYCCCCFCVVGLARLRKNAFQSASF